MLLVVQAYYRLVQHLNLDYKFMVLMGLMRNLCEGIILQLVHLEGSYYFNHIEEELMLEAFNFLPYCCSNYCFDFGSKVASHKVSMMDSVKLVIPDNLAFLLALLHNDQKEVVSIGLRVKVGLGYKKVVLN